MEKLRTSLERWDFLFISLLVLIIIYIKSIAVLFSIYPSDTNIGLLNLSIIAPTLFLISFSLIFSKKGQLFFLLGLDIFISAFFITDIVYARAFGHLISIHMLFAKAVVDDLGASVLSLVRWTDFLMLADLPFVLTAALKAKRKRRAAKKLISFILIAAISAAFTFVQLARFEKSHMISDIKMYPLLISPIGTHMFDLYRFIDERNYKLGSAEISEIESWLNENSKYQQPDADYAGLRGLIKGKNIIAVHFESLENIMINRSYYGQEITPNINRLLKNSIYFDNIHEQVNNGNSSDAELMFNASVYPISVGSAFLRFGENRYVTLPGLLKEEGYTCVAIHGDDKVFWNRNRVYPALGYDEFIDEDMFSDKSSCGMGILDSSLYSQTLTEMKKLKQPYFMSVITLTSHMPFILDEELKYLSLPVDDITGDYLQSIYYADKVFGEFYKRLETEGILDNTVLVLYGDHEGIHKYYSTSLPDNNKEIPFIIVIPGFDGFTVDKIGGQIDIMPTLAYLLGVEKEKYETSVMGRNLFGSAPGVALLSNGEILGETDDKGHLAKAQKISDYIVKGNYFYNRLKGQGHYK